MGVLLSSLLGLLGSALPKVFDFYQDKKDKAHELELVRLQIQRDKEIGTQNANAIEIQGDASVLTAAINASTIKSGIKWVDALSATVRPTVTYLLVLLYIVVKLQVFTELEFTEFDQDLLAVTLGFWFGSRLLQKPTTK